MDSDTIPRTEKGTESVFGWLSWFLLAAGLVTVVVYAAFWEPPPRPLPRFGQVPAFEMDDQVGEKVSLKALKGKVWVGTFMFTNCSNACPAMAAELLKIQKTIRNDGGLDGKLRLVSFSLDPGRDTPQQLSEYSARQGIDSSRWSFLRGAREEVVRLCEQGFGLIAGAGQDPGVLHSDRFVLVDAKGMIRGRYQPSAVPGDLDKLIEGARALIEENQRR